MFSYQSVALSGSAAYAATWERGRAISISVLTSTVNPVAPWLQVTRPDSPGPASRIALGRLGVRWNEVEREGAVDVGPLLEDPEALVEVGPALERGAVQLERRAKYRAHRFQLCPDEVLVGTAG